MASKQVQTWAEWVFKSTLSPVSRVCLFQSFIHNIWLLGCRSTICHWHTSTLCGFKLTFTYNMGHWGAYRRNTKCISDRQEDTRIGDYKQITLTVPMTGEAVARRSLHWDSVVAGKQLHTGTPSDIEDPPLVHCLLCLTMKYMWLMCGWNVWHLVFYGRGRESDGAISRLDGLVWTTGGDIEHFMVPN